MPEPRLADQTPLKKKRSKKSASRCSSDDDKDNTIDDDERQEQRRLKKLRKQADKVVEHFKALGLDEFGQPIDSVTAIKFPVRERQFTLPGSQEKIAINPVVTFIGGILPWLCIFAGILYPTAVSTAFNDWRAMISMDFIWFLQGSKAVIFFFLMFVMFKYGHIKLGGKRDKPEFSTLAYFSMSFTAFVGAVFLTYCLQEPFAHQASNFYAQAGYRSQDEIALFAINMAVSNWGILFWSHYTLVGVSMSLAAHRFNLPLIIRSAYYPILGAYTWGWMGDVLDGFVNFIMIASSASLLDLAARQLVAGFVHMGWVDAHSSAEELNSFAAATVWLIVFVSSASIISGLRAGIRFMSLAAMSCASLLLVLVLFLDDTKYVLNLCVQETGYFLQTSVLQLNFWTDAFGQLKAGSGRAVDGKAAEDWWVDAWVIFSLSWAIIMSLGLGVFQAVISRGRFVWEVICYGVVAPTACSLIWFCTWGGIGFRQVRQGQELQLLGETLFNNSRHFLTDGHEFCYDVPQDDIERVDNGEVVFTNHLKGVSPVCQFDVDDVDNTAIFKVFESFHFASGQGMGSALSMLFLLGIGLFFVTGSDAATLVADSLASNGRKNYHWSRRMYWACTTGFLATILLVSDPQVLEGLDGILYVCSLPAAILVCYLVQSVTLMCRQADAMGRCIGDYQFPNQPEFKMPIFGGIFNAMEYLVSGGKVNAALVELGLDHATRNHVIEFVKGLCVPFLSLYQVLFATYPLNRRTNVAVVAAYTICHYMWIGMWLANGLHGVTCVLLLVAGGILGSVRAGFRARYNLRSNTVADYVSSMLFWPQVLAQMRVQQQQQQQQQQIALGASESAAGETASRTITTPQSSASHDTHKVSTATSDRGRDGVPSRDDASVIYVAENLDSDDDDGKSIEI